MRFPSWNRWISLFLLSTRLVVVVVVAEVDNFKVIGGILAPKMEKFVFSIQKTIKVLEKGDLTMLQVIFCAVDNV